LISWFRYFILFSKCIMDFFGFSVWVLMSLSSPLSINTSFWDKWNPNVLLPHHRAKHNIVLSWRKIRGRGKRQSYLYVQRWCRYSTKLCKSWKATRGPAHSPEKGKRKGKERKEKKYWPGCTFSWCRRCLYSWVFRIRGWWVERHSGFSITMAPIGCFGHLGAWVMMMTFWVGRVYHCDPRIRSRKGGANLHEWLPQLGFVIEFMARENGLLEI